MVRARSQVLGEEIPHAESRQRCASVIDEEWLCRRRRQPALADVGAEQLGRLRPQGAQPLFASFAEEPHVGWRNELHIRGAQVEDLLDAGAGIEHRGQQRVVAATVTRGAIDGQQGGLDLGYSRYSITRAVLRLNGIARTR